MNASSQQSTSQSQSGSSQTQNNPWAPQQNYLLQAFSGAGNALNNSSQYTPEQLASFTNQLNYGNNMSTPTSSANAGNVASAVGAGGLANGLYGLANFTPQGSTASNIANANQYAAGQNIPGQVAADMQIANTEANYVTNPGIDATAAGSGNENSSRDAIEHGLVQTNLAQTANNDAVNLQNQAYSTGLGLSEQQSESQNQNTLASLLGQTSGGANGINAGTNANTGSVGQAGGLFNIANAGAAGQNNDPYQSLQDFYNIIGANNWGGTSNTNSVGTSNGQTTSTPSTMAQLGGWINMAGSLA